jgi:hypothetical protein
MAKTQNLLLAFNGGELSPLLDTRIDTQKYQAGCRTLENMIPLIQGGATRRPGTEYINAAISNDHPSKLVSFEYDVDTKYILEFGEQKIRFYKDGSQLYSGGTVYELTTPYLWADLFQLKFEHSADVMYITHPSYEPRMLARTGDTSWTLTCVTHKKGPFLPQNLDEDLTITPSGTGLSANVDYYLLGDDYRGVAYGSIYLAQSFTASTGYSCTGVKLKLVRNGTPGTVAIKLYATDGSSKPTGAALASGTYDGDTLPAHGAGNWVSVTWASPYTVVSGTKYAIVVNITGGSTAQYVGWRYDSTAASYTGGTYIASADSGASWTLTSTADFMFEMIALAEDVGEPTTVTLTASSALFDEDMAPAGSAATDVSNNGALFRLTQLAQDRMTQTSFVSNSSGSMLVVYAGDTIDYVTTGVWNGTVVVEKSYDNGTTWSAVWSTVSESNANDKSTFTEDFEDSHWRVRMENYVSGTATVRLKARSRLVDRYVQILTVTSSTSATAEVLSYGSNSHLGLINTDATWRWSQGAWSDYMGWPGSVCISKEDRLCFAGSTEMPLTVWGSRAGDYLCFLEGTNDDAAVTFTLSGSGQQDRILWMMQKEGLVLGTLGGEFMLSASGENEAITPTNVQAKIQTTYGSQDIQPILVNDAILFVQRGGRKVREMMFEFGLSNFRADDLTVFSEHITESGIVDWCFQKSPDPILWTVLDNGKIAILCYDRAQQVNSWAKVITKDSSD